MVGAQAYPVFEVRELTSWSTPKVITKRKVIAPRVRETTTQQKKIKDIWFLRCPSRSDSNYKENTKNIFSFVPLEEK